MKHASLFSGIGGFDLASQWMGWENIFNCEINEFCNKILKHYWPNATQFNNITTSDFSVYGGEIDVLTGGFPCQPFSENGKRKGKEDERHLWPHMLRAIKQIRPRWIIGENVYGLVTWNDGMVLNEVYADLEGAGYEVVQPIILPACGIGGIHQRYRVWIIAHSKSYGNNKRTKPHKAAQIPQRIDVIHEFYKRFESTGKEYLKTGICVGDHGISERLDTGAISEKKFIKESLHGVGNAIVPQLAYLFFKIIDQIDQDLTCTT